MNLNAVYELRNRLEMASIAGVNLIQEDFRLRRAVEQMMPLVSVSPVFKKIYILAQSLISPDCKDRPGTLLDTLALVDAVCTTQGTLISGGELMPMEARGGKETAIRNVPYSVMAPVMEAFQGTGGGRYAVIRDAHEVSPELFDDYRIEYQMVKALGDSYAELADMVASWLKEKGEDMIPLLKQDFQPDGKRDMARRVQVIEEIAGGKENEFYRSLVSETREVSKEVKEAAVRALRHEDENALLLLDLLKTEKGKMKEAVLYALSCLDGAEVEEYWSKAIKKKTIEAVSYLENSKTDWASDLIADSVIDWVKDYKAEPEKEQDSKTAKTGQQTAKERQQTQIQRLGSIWRAAEGKHSPRLCQCYETVYQFIPQQVPEVLTRSLILDPHPELAALTEKLFQAHGDAFLEPYAVMAFLTKTKEQVYAMFEPYLKTAGLLERLTGKTKELEGLIKALERIFYVEETGKYQMTLYTAMQVRQPEKNGYALEQGLDERWYPLLLESGHRFASKWKSKWSPYWNRYDAVVAQLYRPDKEELQNPYGAYFYEKAKRQSLTVEGLRLMKRCGWKDYKGLLVTELSRDNSLHTYHIRQILSELPLSNTELAEELDEVLKKIGRKAVNGVGLLEKWRDELKNGGSVETL